MARKPKDKKTPDPIASAMARKRWDKLGAAERKKQTEKARKARWPEPKK